MMASLMRCDGCDALRWYGRPLHAERVMAATDDGGYCEAIVHLCEVCVQAYVIAYSADREPYLPTMHAPHRIMQ